MTEECELSYILSSIVILHLNEVMIDLNSHPASGAILALLPELRRPDEFVKRADEPLQLDKPSVLSRLNLDGMIR